MNAYRTDDYQAKGSLDSLPGARKKIRLLLGLDEVLVPGSLTKPNYNFNRTTSICLDQRGN